MRFASMSRGDRRALTLGALIAVPGLLGPLVVKPYLHVLSAVREQISDERDRLVAERRTIAQLPMLPAERIRASQQIDKELSRLFQSGDELVATGDLAQYVAGVAQANWVQLQQSETRPTQPVAPGVQALQLEIHAQGDLDGILHFLQQLESGGKLIRIGALAIDGGRGPLDAPNNTITSPIRSSGGTGMGASDANRAQGVEVLSLSASIYGYRLSRAPWSSVNTHGKTAPSPFPRAPYAFESLDAVLNHDPFSATRARPSTSYRTVMEQIAHPQTAEQQRPRQPPQLRLLGTVLGSDRASFIMCQNGDAAPRVVHLGEMIDGYTLKSVQRGAAVFSSLEGGQMEIKASALGGSPQERHERGIRRLERELVNASPQLRDIVMRRFNSLSQEVQERLLQQFEALPAGESVMPIFNSGLQ